MWKLLPKIIVESEQTSCTVKKAEFQENIPQELLKYLKQQNLLPAPLRPAMQEIQGKMEEVLSRNDLRDDEKAKRYFQFKTDTRLLKNNWI